MRSAQAWAGAAPANPADGDIWHCDNAAQGGWWELRYNASGSTYKWENCGGTPWYSFQNDTPQPTAGAWLRTGPSFGFAHSGEYVVEWCALVNSPIASIGVGLWDYLGNSVIIAYWGTVAIAGNWITINGSYALGANAGNQIDVCCYTSVQGAYFQQRYLKVLPRRVT